VPRFLAGCAFVTFKTWAAAENAIDALDGKYTFPGANNSITVKFADAKPAELQRVGGKRGGGEMMGSMNKRQVMGTQLGFPGGGAAAGGGGMGGAKGMDMGMGMGFPNMVGRGARGFVQWQA
jgi:membrane protease subunit (stomatin/prohibitin family)